MELGNGSMLGRLPADAFKKGRGEKKKNGKGLVFKMCHTMSRESASLLRRRGCWEDHPAVRNTQRQVLALAFDTRSLSALHLHANKPKKMFSP